MTRGKHKVLLIAEAANPEWVSVPLVGWSLAKALCDEIDGHLVTQVRNKEAIERIGWIEGSDFTAIDTESLARPMWKATNLLRMGGGKGWTMATAIGAFTYPYFEHLVWKKFGPDVRAGKYDIVHRITPLTPTANSSLAKKCQKAGVPFVLGPLNGGVPWPPGFDSERRREREYLSYIRGFYKALPGRVPMLSATSAILTGSRYTASEIPQAHQSKCIYLPENAIDPCRFNRIAAQNLGLPLRGCFIGRMVPYKGADMLLEAAAPFLRDGKLALDMIGDGPMFASLKAIAEREGIEEGVTFHGWLEHASVQKVAVRSNLLLFPSVREFGGGVVLEAMALGVVPVICDYAGPGELVDDTVGYKIQMGSREEIISRLRSQITSIIADPTELTKKGGAARERVFAQFTWEAKASQVLQTYEWVLERRSEKPCFF
ncbi:MAG: glycosyltransferase family 4 protein [Pseudomonadota bacterium]